MSAALLELKHLSTHYVSAAGRGWSARWTTCRSA